jgi:PAS domain-containing protein
MSEQGAPLSSPTDSMIMTQPLVVPSTTTIAASNPKKRKAISRKACENCRKAHACCSDARPCKRCNSQGLECFDVPSKKRGRKRKVLEQPHVAIVSNAASTPTFHQLFIQQQQQQQQQQPLHSTKVEPLTPILLPQYHHHTPYPVRPALVSSGCPPYSTNSNSSTTTTTTTTSTSSHIQQQAHQQNTATTATTTILNVPDSSPPPRYDDPTLIRRTTNLPLSQTPYDYTNNNTHIRTSEFDIKSRLLQQLLVTSTVPQTNQRSISSDGFLVFKLIHDKSYEINFWERFDRLYYRYSSDSDLNHVQYDPSWMRNDLLKNYQIFVKERTQDFKSQSCICGRDKLLESSESQQQQQQSTYYRPLNSIPVEDLPDAEYIQTVLDLCGVAILVYSMMDGRVIVWNKSARDILGYRDADLNVTVKNWMDILKPIHLPLTESQLDEQVEDIRCCEMSRTFKVTCRMRCENNNTRIPLDCISTTNFFIAKRYAIMQLNTINSSTYPEPRSFQLSSSFPPFNRFDFSAGTKVPSFIREMSLPPPIYAMSTIPPQILTQAPQQQHNHIPTITTNSNNNNNNNNNNRNYMKQ